MYIVLCSVLACIKFQIRVQGTLSMREISQIRALLCPTQSLGASLAHEHIQ